MRHLLYLSAGVLGACLISAYAPVPGAALICLVLCLGFSSVSRKSRRSLMAALLFGGAMLGFLWFRGYGELVLKPLKPLENRTLQVSITLTEAEKPRDHGSSANGILRLEGRSYRVRTFFRKDRGLSSGDTAAGPFIIRLIQAPSENRQAGEGIFLMAFEAGEIQTFPAEKPAWWAWPGRFRAYGEKVISWCFSPKAAPFAQALLLGDSGDLPFAVRWDLRISGISHLVAVSGLHISVLCMVISLLTLKNKWLTALLGAPLLLFFGAMTGFSPSVTRACIMMLLFLLAGLLKRRYDPLTELAAAALFMVMLNPYTVASISFQLSCASCLGIFCFYRRIRNQLQMWIPDRGRIWKILGKWITGSAAMSLSSVVFVGPLGLLYFKSLSLIAVVTNLLTVWLVPVIFWGILLCLVVSWFSMGTAMVLGRLCSLGISWILGVSHLLAKIPLAAVFTENPVMVLWVVWLSFWGLYFFRKNSVEPRYFLWFAAGGLCFALCLSWGMSARYKLSMKVYDVGQGQAILLQSGGKNFLVDCGGNREDSVAIQVLTTLRSQGIRRLDGMILTHSDRDHICAADEILSVIQADAVYVPQREGFPPYPAMEIVKGEREISTSQGKLKIFGSESGETSNEMSLCVLLDSSEYDILITGDRSREGEAQLLSHHQIPRVDCLIAGHHGAADSTGEALLKAAEPETVIISAGRKNRYGHPAGETLRRLQSFGCRILRTDTDGTITIRR